MLHFFNYCLWQNQRKKINQWFFHLKMPWKTADLQFDKKLKAVDSAENEFENRDKSQRKIYVFFRTIRTPTPGMETFFLWWNVENIRLRTSWKESSLSFFEELQSESPKKLLLKPLFEFSEHRESTTRNKITVSAMRATSANRKASIDINIKGFNGINIKGFNPANVQKGDSQFMLDAH